MVHLKNFNCFILLIIFYILSCNHNDVDDIYAEYIECDFFLNAKHTPNLIDFNPPVNYINHIVNDSNGNIYFSQFMDTKIGLLDSIGNFKQWIGTLGKGPGDYLSTYMVLDHNDSLFVQDYLLGRITVYAPGTYKKHHRIIRHDPVSGEILLATINTDFYLQANPYYGLYYSNKNISIISMSNSGELIDTVFSLPGPEYIVEKSNGSIKVLQAAALRNVYITFGISSFSIFENDRNIITEFDYSGNLIYEFEIELPHVSDYSKLLERQFRLTGGISGDHVVSTLEKLSTNYDGPTSKALYHEAIRIGDDYFFKLILTTDESKWLVHKKRPYKDESYIYCSDDPNLSIKGHNGHYYYGLSIAEDYSQYLVLLLAEPMKSAAALSSE